MISMPWLSKNGRALLLLSTLSCASLSLATAQELPAFKPGEVLLYCQPNTTQEKVQELAGKINAERVVPLLLPDCYQLILPENARTNLATTDAVSNLKGDVSVRSVRPFYTLKRMQTSTVEPNDPRYKSGEMWGLKMIKMPQAWALTKGFAGTNVAVIDSGFNPAHEDLQGQYHADSRDIADNDADILAGGSGTPPEAHHGTHVSGTIVAKTNNNLGIAGICWENIKCVGLKIEKNGTNNLDGAAYINALAYVAAKAKEANIKVLNMSLGGAGDPNDSNNPEYVAVKSITDQGVLVVASAGNDAGSAANNLPSAFPFVISVAAVRPNGQPTSYSNFNKIDLAAPGGELSEGQASGILSTLDANNYAFEQGTSMAAPHVAGVAGLVMSVPGVTAQFARAALQETAIRTNVTGALPSANLGYGVVDAAIDESERTIRIAR